MDAQKTPDLGGLILCWGTAVGRDPLSTFLQLEPQSPLTVSLCPIMGQFSPSNYL